MGVKLASILKLYEVAIMPTAVTMLAWAEIRELRLLIANKASVVSTRT